MRQINRRYFEAVDKCYSRACRGMGLEPRFDLEGAPRVRLDRRCREEKTTVSGAKYGGGTYEPAFSEIFRF
jgi:hypothetical protein